MAKVRRSPAIRLLSTISRLLPGDYLKTTFYLYLIAKPRTALRLMTHGFYRFDHVYDVLEEVRGRYKGRFTILEFGTNEGYAFIKILYAARYLGMEDRVTVHGFDTFEGMPESTDPRDENIIFGDQQWIAGQYTGNYERLDDYCRTRYRNYRLHKGLFSQTLSAEFLESLIAEPPVLVWLDCDYYTSARDVMERLLPYMPNGCVIYFDEYEFNYGSRFTGEARLVHEINEGKMGEDVELILDTHLSLASARIYRFMRFPNGRHFESREARHPLESDPGRGPTNGSPFP